MLVQRSRILFPQADFISKHQKTAVWGQIWKHVISTNEEKSQGLFNNQVLKKPINQYYFVNPDHLHTRDCAIKCGSWEQGLERSKWVTSTVHLFLFQIFIKTWNQIMTLFENSQGRIWAVPKRQRKAFRVPISAAGFPIFLRSGPRLPRRNVREWKLQGPRLFPYPSPQNDTANHFLLELKVIKS